MNSVVIYFSIIVSTLANSNELFLKFLRWKEIFKKNYFSQPEELFRFHVFQQNLNIIDEHNSNPLNTYTLGENQFLDLTNDEFLSILGASILDEEELKIQTDEDSDTFLNNNYQNEVLYDWSSYCFTNKDQGNCGAGWAFATSGIMECYVALHQGILIEVSEQQLIDCVQENNGCETQSIKDIINAFEYANEYPISNNLKYPFTGKQGKCQGSKGYPSYSLTQFETYSGSKFRLVDTLAKGPVIGSFDVSGWQFYQDGTYDCSKDKSPNHNAIIVKTIAYKENEQNDYVLIHNSWGSNWGQKGHIKYNLNEECQVFQRPFFASFRVGS